MFFRSLVAASVMLAACSATYAAEFQHNWIACDSEDTYDAYNVAMSQNDRASMNALKLGDSCVNTSELKKRGASVVILKRGLAMLTVQVTVGRATGVLYTSTGAVK